MSGNNIGIGASIGINNINRDAIALVGSLRDDPGGTLGTDSIDIEGDLTLHAETAGDIKAFSLAATRITTSNASKTKETSSRTSKTPQSGDSGQQGKYGVGISGDVSINNITDVTRAEINDLGTLRVQGLMAEAINATDIVSASGSAAISQTGKTSVGMAGSYSENRLAGMTRSGIAGANVVQASSIALQADRTGEIFSVAVGGAGAPRQNGVAIAGSVSINEILDNTEVVIDAASVDVTGDITLDANSQAQISSIAGGIAFGGRLGFGSAVSVNNITSNTRATVTSSTVQHDGWVSVEAQARNTVESITASVGLSKKQNGFGVSGTVSVNEIGGTMGATMTDSILASTVDSGITITAEDTSEIRSISGAIGGAKRVGLGAAVAFNGISGKIEAFIDNTQISNMGQFALLATSGTLIESIAVAGSAAKNGALAGSVAVNEIGNNIDAAVLNGSTVDVGSSRVTADETAIIRSLAGSVAVAQRGAIGAAVASNLIANTTTARADASSIQATDAQWLATGAATIESLTVGGAGAGSFALGGSVSLNEIGGVLASSITGSVVNADDVRVESIDNSEIDALAGGLSFASKAAVGAAVATNAIAKGVRVNVDDGNDLTVANQISLDAASQATLNTITAGGSGAGTFALGGSISLNELGNIVEVLVDGNSTLQAGNGIDATARDQATIHSLAGTVAGAGTTSVGAAIATNDIATQVLSTVGAAQLDTGHLTLSAETNANIQTLSAGVSGAGTAAISGAVSSNAVNGLIVARISNGAVATVSGDVAVLADDNSLIQSISGQAGGAGTAAIGGAAAYNEVANSVTAGMEQAVLDALGNILVAADSAATIESIAAGGSGGGTAGVAGSVVINYVASSTEAFLSGGTVAAAGSIAVLADANFVSQVYGGTLTIGGTVGFGGTVVTNTFDNQTRAYVDAGSTVTALGATPLDVPAANGTDGTQSIHGVAVVATAREDIRLLTANLSGGGTAGVAANVSVTSVEGDTNAFIRDSTINPGNTGAHSEQVVLVKADQRTDIDVLAGGLALGGTAGIGATSDTTTISNSSSAFINNATVQAASDVQVMSQSHERVNAIVVSGAGAGTGALAGNVAVVHVDGTNGANVEDSVVHSGGDLTVQADNTVQLGVRKDGSRTAVLAGSLAIGGVAGVGGSVVVTTIQNDTSAQILASTTDAVGATNVVAESVEDVMTFAATGAIGGYLGAAGSVVVNTVEPVTTAAIDGLSWVNQDNTFTNSLQNVNVTASDTVRVTSTPGALGGGLVGVAASIDVANVNPATTALIGTAVVVHAGGDVSVLANENRDVHSTVVSFGAGAVGVQGAISVVNIGTTMSTRGASESANTGAATDQQIRGAGNTKVGDQLGSSETAVTAKARADSRTSGLSVSGQFDATDLTLGGTTALIAGSINADGAVQVIADDDTDVQILAGGASAGAVGIGASVGVANVEATTSAFIASSASLAAGGDVTVHANLDEDVTGEGFAGQAGIVSVGGAVIVLTDESSTTAHVDLPELDQAGVVKIHATADRDLTAVTGQGSVGGIAAGGSVAHVFANGATSAYLADAAQIGQDPTQTVDGLEIIADSDTRARADATALAAGAVAGALNEAKAIVQDDVSAKLGNHANVTVTGAVVILAKAKGASVANSTGVTASLGASVASSSAIAQGTYDVDAEVGSGANITAGDAIQVAARFNVDEMGTPLAKAADAQSKSSAGSLLVGLSAGGTAEANSSAATTTTIGSDARLNAPHLVNIESRAFNEMEVDSDGNAAGFLALSLPGAATTSKAISTTSATTSIDNLAQVGTDGSLPLEHLHVGAYSETTVNADTMGSSGQDIASALENLFTTGLGSIFTGSGIPSLLANGGTLTEVVVNNDATASIGTDVRLRATQGLMLSADATTRVRATGDMEAGSVFRADAASVVDVKVNSDAIVSVGDRSEIHGNVVVVKAINQVGVSASIDATVNASFGEGVVSGITRIVIGVGGPSQALVNLGQDVSLRGEESVILEALNKQIEAFPGQSEIKIHSNPRTDAFGAFTSTATSVADGSVDVDALVITGAGTELATSDLEVNADTEYTLHRDPDAQAGTVASTIVETVERVSRTIRNRVCNWFPWPLNLVCDVVVKVVTELVTTFVEVFDFSNVVAKQGGSGLQENSEIDLNGEIVSIGAEDKTLVVDPDGNVSGNVTDVLVTSTDVIVNSISGGGDFDLEFNVPDGTLGGTVILNVNKVVDQLDIDNQSDRNLVLKSLDLTGGAGSTQQAPSIDVHDISFNAETVLLNFESGENTSTLVDSTVNILNRGSGDILFAEPISNVAATFDIANLGGGVQAADSSVFLETGDVGFLRIQAAGDIGSAAQPLRTRLVRGKLMPDGTLADMPAELIASSGGSMYLDVTGVNTLFDSFDPAAVVDGIALHLNAENDINVVVGESEIVSQETVLETIQVDFDDDGVIDEEVEIEKLVNVSHQGSGRYDIVNASSASGNVDIDVQTGDLRIGKDGGFTHYDLENQTVGQISSPQGTTRLTAAGAIVDLTDDGAHDIHAAGAVLNANGIGTNADALETKISHLEASAGDGGLWIDNEGDIELGGASGQVGVAAAGGVNISAASTITISETVSGPVDLHATDDIVVNADIRSAGNPVGLAAERNIEFGANGLIDVESGDPSVVIQADTDDDAQGHLQMAAGSQVHAVDGTVAFDAGQEIVLSQLSTSADVNVHSASGSIFGVAQSDAHIAAASLHLTAGGGIGTASQPVQTDLYSIGSGLNASAVGSVVVTETEGDLFAGVVTSVDGDIQLDAASGDLEVGLVTAPMGTVGLGASGGIHDTAHSIVGTNIQLTAGGGIGSAANPLDIDSSVAAVGGVSAAAEDSIYVHEIAGDLHVASMTSSAGNIQLTTADGSVVIGSVTSNQGDVNITATESILDDVDSGTTDVTGQGIVLSALAGSIGSSANPLEVDTAHSGPGMLFASAADDIFVTETEGALSIGSITSQSGTIGLASAGDLILNGDVSAPDGVDLAAEGSLLIKNQRHAGRLARGQRFAIVGLEP